MFASLHNSIEQGREEWSEGDFMSSSEEEKKEALEELKAALEELSEKEGLSLRDRTTVLEAIEKFEGCGV